MLDLYYWTTPNGHKITIFLEEAGLPYRINPVNIGKGEQFARTFLEISPNNRIPAIVDNEPGDGGKPIQLFESGAILLYLAEKTGQLLPKDPVARFDAIQWMMVQMTLVGPMFGQYVHFMRFAPKGNDYAFDRYPRKSGGCSLRSRGGSSWRRSSAVRATRSPTSRLSLGRAGSAHFSASRPKRTTPS